MKRHLRALVVAALIVAYFYGALFLSVSFLLADSALGGYAAVIAPALALAYGLTSQKD